MVLWSKSYLCCQEIGNSVHRKQSSSLIHSQHFMDTPAIQFGRVGIAKTNQQLWHYLLEAARPQPLHKSAGGTRANRNSMKRFWLCFSQQSKNQQSCKTIKCCTVRSTSKPSAAFICGVLFILPPHTMCLPRAMPQHRSCLSM